MLILAKGMVGFTRSKGVMSRLIRFLSNAPWSHTFILLDRGLDGKFGLIEADWAGVGISSMTKYEKGTECHLCQVSGANADLGLAAVCGKLGRQYGYGQIIGLAVALPLRVIGVKLKNPLTEGTICSELVCEYLSAATGDVSWKRMKDNASPGDVYRRLKTQHGFIEIGV